MFCRKNVCVSLCAVWIFLMYRVALDAMQQDKTFLHTHDSLLHKITTIEYTDYTPKTCLIARLDDGNYIHATHDKQSGEKEVYHIELKPRYTPLPAHLYDKIVEKHTNKT